MKFKTAFATVVAAGLLVAACGDDEKESPKTTTAPSGTTGVSSAGMVSPAALARLPNSPATSMVMIMLISEAASSSRNTVC